MPNPETFFQPSIKLMLWKDTKLLIRTKYHQRHHVQYHWKSTKTLEHPLIVSIPLHFKNHFLCFLNNRIDHMMTPPILYLSILFWERQRDSHLRGTMWYLIIKLMCLIYLTFCSQIAPIKLWMLQIYLSLWHSNTALCINATFALSILLFVNVYAFYKI